ncbi:hypothetical protein VHEMI06283 [[Torrubiella] hemipterigena]|uniref:Uncharacterized protein n=1 Tax=[Torrubiella] hemipterigena TaxID=1531966 RepID=A0A0A1TIQ4_9HYPO|nr:hypothetical protein VHEMI06283 [[Torrubiella] hemipterigena]
MGLARFIPSCPGWDPPHIVTVLDSGSGIWDVEIAINKLAHVATVQARGTKHKVQRRRKQGLGSADDIQRNE